MAVRICFINPLGRPLFFTQDVLPSQSQFGGAEVQLYYIATELAKDDNFDVSTIVESQQSGCEVSEGVAVYGVRPMARVTSRIRSRFPLPSWNYYHALRRVDADIYVQRGGAVLTGDVAMFCRIHKRRFAFMTAHLWDCDRTHQGGKDWLCGHFYNFGLRSADFVFTQAEQHRQLLKKHYFIDSQLLSLLYPPESCHQSTNDRQIILWVGRCLEWKRPWLFLELAQELPDCEFVMVCPPHDSARHLFERMKATSETLDNVTFIGRIPFDQTHGLFRSTLVFVNTSISEGFPNTFVQAARSGVPIVSLKVDPDGILQRANIGFGCNDDFDACRHSLGLLINDKTLRGEYSKSCLTYFEENHVLSNRITTVKRSLTELLEVTAAEREFGRPAR